MGIRYTLACNNTVQVAEQGLTWGIIVVPTGIGAANVNPNTQQHLDWMEWGKRKFTQPAASVVNVVGLGDDGFRTVRSRRKLAALEEDLLFVLLFDAGASTNSYFIQASVVLAMA